jgi:glyoxylase-like metal-dependent hydrolase (beta-lactamase superfamily II)
MHARNYPAIASHRASSSPQVAIESPPPEEDIMRKLLLSIALVTTLTAIAVAQQAGGGRGAAPEPVAAPRQLKPGFFLITGAGANTGVRVTPEGLIVVDTKNPSTETNNIFAGLNTQLKVISPLPVKYIINTHHHPDHTGNNGALVDLGAKVIGLEALKTNMAADSRTAQIPGRPTETFAKDYVLKFGGVQVDAHHYGNAHTNDDTVVYFPDLKIAMISDTVYDTNPVVDWANGGSVLGWKTSLDAILKLDFEIAIPGRGEPRPKADVAAFKTKIDTVIDRGNAAIKAGATKETFMAQVKLDDLGWMEAKPFFDNLYDELTKK